MNTLRKRLMAISLLATVLAGCTGTGVKESQTSADSAAWQVQTLNSGLHYPLVAVGDRFVFTNPEETWQVTAIKEPYITWTSSTGEQLLSSYNPFYPAIQWLSNKQSGNRRIEIIEGGLFPLKKGAAVSFIVDGQTERPPANWRAEWHCHVEGQKDIVVPAGKSNSWRILCLRNGQEEILFDFDPTIGHYVQIAAAIAGKTTVRQLQLYTKGNVKKYRWQQPNQ